MSINEIIGACFGGVALIVLVSALAVCLIIGVKTEKENKELQNKKIKLEIRLLEERVKNYE